MSEGSTAENEQKDDVYALGEIFAQMARGHSEIEECLKKRAAAAKAAVNQAAAQAAANAAACMIPLPKWQDWVQRDQVLLSLAQKAGHGVDTTATRLNKLFQRMVAEEPRERLTAQAVVDAINDVFNKEPTKEEKDAERKRNPDSNLGALIPTW